MVARWYAKLAQFPAEIEHREGRKHGNADGLSRSCKQCKREECPIQYLDELDDQPFLRQNRSMISSEDLDLIPYESGEDWICQILKTERQEQLDISLQTIQIVDYQLKDQAIQTVMEWLKQGQRPIWSEVKQQERRIRALWIQWGRLCLQDGLLYRTSGKDATETRVVLPLRLVTMVLDELHSQKFGGHLGVDKTLGRIKARFYWPFMAEDVRDWCAACPMCAGKKVGKDKKQRMGTVQSRDRLDRVAMDILDITTTSSAGNRYILVVSDYFTKWTEAFALPNHQAETVAEKFVAEFVCRWGMPISIHTDQGREFESKLFKGICDLMGGHKTKTCPYHPQSDGMVERFNRTCITMLSAFVTDHKQDWDLHLPFIMAAYRSSIHESTGFTPMKMMTGQEMNLPIDLMMKEARPPPDMGLQTPGQYVTWMRSALQEAYDSAREVLGRAATRQKRAYDQKAVDKKFPRGSWVLRYYPPVAQHKLHRPWTRPYLVVDSAQGWTIGIQRTAGGVVRWVHIDDLKACAAPQHTANWLLDSNAAPTIPSERTEGRPNIPKTVIMERSVPTMGDEVENETNSSSSVPEGENHPIYFKGPQAPLSNFFPVRIWHDGRWFDSTEHVYQYQKAERYGTKSQIMAIWRAVNPVTAMRLGKKISPEPTWRDEKVIVMEKLLWAKVIAISTMSVYLLGTGNHPLVEATPNLFWGAGLPMGEIADCPLDNLPGKNQLGKLWMDIRETLRIEGVPVEIQKAHATPNESTRLRPTRGRKLQR